MSKLKLRGGAVITLEGLDGCGKTTQARMLCEGLRQQNFEVVHTKEPGGTPAADKIRALLLEGVPCDTSTGVLVSLFLAAKLELQERIVRPALERGAIVVCERGWWSMFAYQGSPGTGVTSATLERLRDLAPLLGALSPHEGNPQLQLLLRQSVNQSRSRVQARAETLDNFEVRPVEFFEHVHGVFDRAFYEPSLVSNVAPTLFDIDVRFNEIRTHVDAESRTPEDIAKDVLSRVYVYRKMLLLRHNGNLYESVADHE